MLRIAGGGLGSHCETTGPHVSSLFWIKFYLWFVFFHARVNCDFIEGLWGLESVLWCVGDIIFQHLHV